MREQSVLKKIFFRYKIRTYSVTYSSFEQSFTSTHSNDSTILQKRKIISITGVDKNHFKCDCI